MTTTEAVPVPTADPAADPEAVAARVIGILNDGAICLLAGIGHELGLFDTLAGLPPATSAQLADAAGVDERYVREWLGGVVTAGFVEHVPADRTYYLCPDHAPFLTGTGPDNLARVMRYLPLMAQVTPQIVDKFRTGGGLSYDDYPGFHDLQAAESAAVNDSALLDTIVPITDEVGRLEAGIDVADIGCGEGHAINLLARAFPRSSFVGYDFSEDALVAARAEAAAWGMTNARFETLDVAALDVEAAYDLVLTFDAIHDQAHPATVLANVRRALRPGGTYLMVDINAQSDLEGNLEPAVGVVPLHGLDLALHVRVARPGRRRDWARCGACRPPNGCCGRPVSPRSRCTRCPTTPSTPTSWHGPDASGVRHTPRPRPGGRFRRMPSASRSAKDFFRPLAVGAPDPVHEVPARPSRAIHFFDPSNEKMAAKIPAMVGKVDVLLGNLEDAVKADNKEAARAGLVSIAQSTDFGPTQLWTRINALDSPWVLDDLTTLVTEIGDKLDVIMVPKVQEPADIHYVDRLLAQLEARAGLERPILVHAILETARGVANVEEICGASPRMQGLSLGPADLAADRRMKTTRVGGGHPGYLVRQDPDPQQPDKQRQTFQQDLWHYTIARMVDACAMHGIYPYYGPFGDIADEVACEDQFRNAFLLGCVGTWSLHPKQIAIAHRVFSPSVEDIRHARRVVAALQSEGGDGTGAVMLDGKMEDDASLKQCLVMVELAEQLAAVDPQLKELYEGIGDE